MPYRSRLGGFGSIGAAMTDEMTQILVEREAARRQAMLDAIAAQEREQSVRDRQVAREIQRAQLESTDAQRKEAIQRMQQQRAGAVADTLQVGQDIDGSTAAILREGDLGALVQQQLNPQLNVTAGMPVPGASTGPAVNMNERTLFSGTAGQHAARARADAEKAEKEAARAAAAEQARLNREAATERARETNETRRTLATIAASGKADTQALGNQLRQIQIDAAQDKLDAGRKERAQLETGQREQIQETLDVVNAMLDSQGVGAGLDAATGAYELRGFTQPAQNFNAYRDRLAAMLTAPNLKYLKGPLSDKDIIFVQNLSTNLANRRMSGELTRQNLLKLQELLTQKAKTESGATGGTSTDAVVEWEIGPDGKPRRK